MKQYFRICTLLISSLCFATNSENSNIQTVRKIKSEFNLNNLYSKNKYSTMDYGAYNTQDAIEFCKTQMIPEGGIWPNPSESEPPIPTQIPTNANCENLDSSGPNTQIAYGCNADLSNPNSIGTRFTHSVVKISIPKLGICSGTLIAESWIIAAAHCVTDRNGAILSQLENFPLKIRDFNGKRIGIIDDIYIPANYRYYITKIPDYQKPYAGYYNGDIALLHLQKPLPAYFYPITLATESLPENSPVWLAGYGRNEKQTSGQFQFRQQYFITNIFYSQRPDRTSGDFGELYITGSKPEIYKGINSAWSFSSFGDSGGPIIWQDHNGKLYLEGVHSSALYCNYPGYFAKMPYPLKSAVSTLKYGNLIRLIIKGLVNKSDVRYIHLKTWQMLFIISNNNTITSYNILENDNLEQTSTLSTGTYPTGIATMLDKSHTNYVFVSNLFNSTISRYKVDENNKLQQLEKLKIESRENAPYLIDVKTSDTSLYVIDKANHIITSYDKPYAESDSNSIHYMYTTESEPGKSEVINMENSYTNKALFVTHYNDQSISIYRILDDAKLNFIGKIKLDSIENNIGNPVELSAVPEYPEYFYLLTTTGVFLLKYTEGYNIKKIAYYRAAFDIYSHVKAISIYKCVVTIGDKIQNLKRESHSNILTVENFYYFNEIGGIEALNEEFLYATENNKGSRLFKFYINQNKFKQVESADAYSTIVKYSKWYTSIRN